jgi:hypothetical protein
MQQRTVRVKSDEVQGPDSFVVVRRMTVGETKEIMRATAGREAGLDTYSENGLWVADHVVEWNWTDGEGQALPFPKNDATVIDRLTNEELAFLNQAIVGRNEAERKN